MVVAFLGALILIVGALAFLTVQVERGKRRSAEELASAGPYSKLSPFGAVRRLSVLPLADYYTGSAALKGEPGVSYLIRADDTTILLDVGLNAGAAHPSPLLHNMRTLSIDPARIDMLFFSHVHSDHSGGLREFRAGEFSLSQGAVALRSIPAYAPAPLKPSQWNPGPRVEVVQGPKVLGTGIASLGPMPRYLFLLGYVREQALAVNVAGKGIVLIVGCGHQGVAALVRRAQEIFDEPLYGILGGLHLPVDGGRVKVGFLDLQQIVASDRFPWPGRGEDDVREALETLQRFNLGIVAISPHDSSDWTINQFKQAFGARYREIKVGEELTI